MSSENKEPLSSPAMERRAARTRKFGMLLFIISGLGILMVLGIGAYQFRQTGQEWSPKAVLQFMFNTKEEDGVALIIPDPPNNSQGSFPIAAEEMNSELGIFPPQVMTHWDSIQQVASEEGVSAYIIGAVVTTKSCGDAFAMSSGGSGTGLMHISLTWHSARFAGESPTDPLPNLRVGAQLLREWGAPASLETAEDIGQMVAALNSYSGNADNTWVTTTADIASQAAQNRNQALQVWLASDASICP